jgi:hypothetical protein
VLESWQVVGSAECGHADSQKATIRHWSNRIAVGRTVLAIGDIQFDRDRVGMNTDLNSAIVTNAHYSAVEYETHPPAMKVNSCREEITMIPNQTIANALLWASAIIASAAVGAPALLSVVLLPALAFGSLLAMEPKFGRPKCRVQ